MATNLTGNTIASTYEKLIKRADTYVAAGVNIEVQDDSAAAAASSLYLDITNGNVGIGDTLPDEAKLSITGVASGDAGIKVVQAQTNAGIEISKTNTGNGLYMNHTGGSTGAGISMDNQNTSGNGMNIYMSHITTGSGLLVNNACTSMATTAEGGLVEITSTVDTDTNVNNLLYLSNDHADSTATTCLFMNQDADHESIFIDSEATTSAVVMIQAAQSTTGHIINIDDADHLTTGSALMIKSNSPDNTSSRNLIHVINENAAADKTVGLLIQQDGDDAHIEFTGVGGGGIKFTADIASSDSDTLDDYEEGTWTGVVSDGTNNMTMSNDSGYYTKVGNLVTVSGYFTTASPGSASGDIRITGLPFTISNNNAAYSGGGAAFGNGLAITAGHSVSYHGGINDTYVWLGVWDATTGTTSMQASEWSGDGGIILGFSYRAA